VSVDRDIVVEAMTDPTAFALIFRRHLHRIFQDAARRVRSDSAQDIMCETFVIAFIVEPDSTAL
jgi:RNA polymerase sigma-70 factor (ECF subfamily)